MTRSTKAAVIGLLIVLIVAAVALVWYILQPQMLIDTDTLSVVRDGSTITVHDLVADEVYTFRIVRVRRSEGVTESHRAVDTATISIDTIRHGGLKITDKTAGKVYIVRRVGHS
jgi:transcription elongation GreA/GreB family factor